MDPLEEKLQEVRTLVRRTHGLAIAFSGGTDSTLVTRVARDELRERVVAVTVISRVHSSWEQHEAAEAAAFLGVPHELVKVDVFEIPGFAENPPDRCYRCKREILRLIREVAEKRGLSAVADGTHADDLHGYRPGLRALREQGVLSPLLQAGLNKTEVRILSRRLGLPTADKPPWACLATRFPYGTVITAEALSQVEALEAVLRSHGFYQVRVRYHGPLARIEVPREEVGRLTEPAIREQVVSEARRAGFSYVAVDLEGYRSGSFDELIRPSPRDRAS